MRSRGVVVFKGVRRALIIVIFLCVAVIVFGWIGLESGAFSDQRRTLVSRLLTTGIGQKVEVSGDIRLRLGFDIHFWVEDVTVQSAKMPDVNVLQIKELRFDADTWGLINSRFDWDDFILSGAEIRFLKKENGDTSWGEAAASTRSVDQINQQADGILDILRNRHVEIKESTLNIELQDSGFDFEAVVDEFRVTQENNRRLTLVKGSGTLNGQDLSLDGSFPADETFNAEILVGGSTSKITGNPLQGTGGTEYEATLTTKIASLGDLQEAAGLKRTTEGQGSLNADLEGAPGQHSVRNLKLVTEDNDGRHLQISGEIEDFFRFGGTNLAFALDFEPSMMIFQPKSKTFEVALEKISATLTGNPESFYVNDVSIETTAFHPKLKKIGPIQIGKLFRTDDGEISLTGIYLVAGQGEQPYFTLDGEVTDVMQLKGIDLKSHLRMPATRLFPFNHFKDENALGLIEGDILVSDSAGSLGINSLQLKSTDTDIWEVSTSASVGSLEYLENITTDTQIKLPNPAAFLNILGAQSKISEPIQVGWTAQNSSDGPLALDATLAFARTDVEAKLSFGTQDDKPSIEGNVLGHAVHITDVRRLVALGKAVASLVEDPYANRKAKPLVIVRDAKPLVIERDAKPLVIARASKPLALGEPEKPLDIMKLAQEAIVRISIEFSKVLGVSGLNKVNAVLQVKDGIANLDPITLSVVGGAATASVTSDLRKTPQLLRSKGKLGGVRLETLMTLANSKIEAEGIISGPFDISFDIRRMSNLLATASGSTTLRLDNGRIATSLLNLVGLGVIPWLFSKELRAGYTDITCAIAPFSLARGTISIREAIIDTPRVQVLVNGQVNVVNDTLAIRAVPRPLNRAEARSPFPVSVTGTFSNPEVRIERGADSGATVQGTPDSRQAHKPCVPVSN